MKILKELDMTAERTAFEELKAMQEQLSAKARQLEQRIDEKAHEYYGDAGWNGFRKANSHTYTTEDGYTVRIDDYQIGITKPLENGTFRGYGTIYDKGYNDLSIHILYASGRDCDGYAKKYESERQRMKDIQDTEKIFNPFGEFEGSRILSFFNNKYMN
ncbi:MAG: hypothetical protein AB7D36_09030 [Oscillospiraceae bacterium]